MFTTDQTLNEILSEESVKKYLDVVFSEAFIDMIAPEYFDIPLCRVGKECMMPWGLLFPADEFVKSVNRIAEIADGSVYDIEPLWQEKVQGYMPEKKDHDHKRSCLITKVKTTEKGAKKPAVIVCPGGGYEMLSMSQEGFDMADRMEEAGYKAFVCMYRVKPNRYPLPQEDLAIAVKFVRVNAEKYGIDPENVMVMGSSAGGHLCASLGYLHEEIDAAVMKDVQILLPDMVETYKGISCKPDKICLNYAVISFLSEVHEPSFQELSGGDESLREALSVEQHVDKTYPKTFIWACADDDVVPVSNSVRMAEALGKAGCDHECHIYPTGGHGQGLANGTSAKEWSDRLIEFMK